MGAFENTHTLYGSPLKFKLSSAGYELHRDSGVWKVGDSSIYFNPYWGMSQGLTATMNWWDATYRWGFVGQWGRWRTWSNFTLNPDAKKTGPG